MTLAGNVFVSAMNTFFYCLFEPPRKVYDCLNNAFTFLSEFVFKYSKYKVFEVKYRY